MVLAFTILRYVVFGSVALAALAAFAAMAVQRRAISPFGKPARAIRRLTDPLIKPVERRVLRSGGNPQMAPWWMLAVAVLAGILAISGAEWAFRQVFSLRLAAGAGPRTIVFVLIGWIFALLKLAIIVRVIGSWLGVGPHTSWMKPFYLATEWFLAPLRRVLPTLGPIDISPIVAWFLLDLLARVLGGIL